MNNILSNINIIEYNGKYNKEDLITYNDFKRIIYFGIACLIVLLVFLTETFYYKNVSDEKISNIEVVILTDTFIVSIIVFVVVLVIYFLGV